MRVLILGGTGMLGHKLAQQFSNHFETFVTVRGDASNYYHFPWFEGVKVLGGVEASGTTIATTIATVKPDVVLNAIGVVKQVADMQAKDAYSCINGLLPHQIADSCSRIGARFIGISTDCVFSGSRGSYREEDIADATDAYGITKLYGEVSEGDSLTIRTSIIGREVFRTQGLVEWFIGCRGLKVRGYRNAFFNGFPTIELADILVSIISDFPKLSGLLHVSSESISKYEVLTILNSALSLGVEIREDFDVSLDRTLDSSKFRAVTGFVPRNWDAMLERLCQENTVYSKWRKR